MPLSVQEREEAYQRIQQFFDMGRYTDARDAFGDLVAADSTEVRTTIITLPAGQAPLKQAKWLLRQAEAWVRVPSGKQELKLPSVAGITAFSSIALTEDELRDLLPNSEHQANHAMVISHPAWTPVRVARFTAVAISQFFLYNTSENLKRQVYNILKQDVRNELRQGREIRALEILAESGDTHVLSDSLIQQICEDGFLAVSADPRVDSDLLELCTKNALESMAKFQEHNNPARHLIGNPNVDGATILALVDFGGRKDVLNMYHYGYKLIQNPNAPTELLDRAYTRLRSEVSVREALARHKNTSDATLKVLAKSTVPAVSIPAKAQLEERKKTKSGAGGKNTTGGRKSMF